MAASASNMPIPLSKALQHDASPPSSSYARFSAAPLTSLTQKSLSKRNPTTIWKASSNEMNSFLLSIAELQRKQEEKMQRKTPKTDHQQLADVWREIHGLNDWAGILDPIHPLLRSELIRYGEMAQACYDAFDYDPYSRYCGSCRFTPSKFFESLGLTHLGYQITQYFYSTHNINYPHFSRKSRWPKLWSKHANWAGYMAVSDDETSKRLGRRDITLGWRGTVTQLEWIRDLMDFLVPVTSRNIPCPDPTVKVENSFLELYTDKENDCPYNKYSPREQVLMEVKRLVEIYSDEKLSITITGHSLGSALAVLSAYDIAESGSNVTKDGRVVPVSVFSFSGPRVGNVRFKERLGLLGVKVLRVVNVHDVVPKTPGLLFNEHTTPEVKNLVGDLPWSYTHVGVELELDHTNSLFLNPDADAVCTHNLEALLHLLDGYHGTKYDFVMASGRDLALVNKACNFLYDHLLVPPYWRQDSNKGMFKGKDGRWMPPERPKLEEGQLDDMHEHHVRQLEMSLKTTEAYQANQQVAAVWREIHGKNDWFGLLDPMDPLLRSELIRYGEMAQACYDAFDYEPHSKYSGSCRFTRPKFFESLGMNNHLGYQVTRYLYATLNLSNLPFFLRKSRLPKLWSKHANWAGYVAVSDDDTSKLLGRRDITIAWRGAVTDLERDLMNSFIPIPRGIPSPHNAVKVESRFLELYSYREDNCGYSMYSAREQVLTEVKRLVDKYLYEELSITITGHSLGSALAILTAYDIVETGLNIRKDGQGVPVSVFSFSSPRVGNARFKERLEFLGVKVLNVSNVRDAVPGLPWLLLNVEQALPMLKVAVDSFLSQVGVQLELDHKNSPFLSADVDAFSMHNLEALFHLLDGYHGKDLRFVLASGRDPALVNKACNFLKYHYLVPAYWRQEGNKGMIKDENGRWVSPGRPKLEGHPEDMPHFLDQLGLSDFSIEETLPHFLEKYIRVLSFLRDKYM